MCSMTPLFSLSFQDSFPRSTPTSLQFRVIEVEGSALLGDGLLDDGVGEMDLGGLGIIDAHLEGVA